MEGTATDLGNGSYGVKYKVQHAGWYTLAVTLHGKNIKVRARAAERAGLAAPSSASARGTAAGCMPWLRGRPLGACISDGSGPTRPGPGPVWLARRARRSR
jgi:hypothetical protein